jgi:hypothetical protein
MKKKVFIIRPVRLTNYSIDKAIEGIRNAYSETVEIHDPSIHTDQEANEYEICSNNSSAIKNADEIWLWYNDQSKGSHFDIGIAFTLNKPIRFINNVNKYRFCSEKTFVKMIDTYNEIHHSKYFKEC